MGGIGFEEILVVIVVAVILYGKELPSAARKVATVYGKVRRYMSDMRAEIARQIPAEEIDLRRDLDEAALEASREPSPDPPTEPAPADRAFDPVKPASDAPATPPGSPDGNAPADGGPVRGA